MNTERKEVEKGWKAGKRQEPENDKRLGNDGRDGRENERMESSDIREMGNNSAGVPFGCRFEGIVRHSLSFFVMTIGR